MATRVCVAPCGGNAERRNYFPRAPLLGSAAPPPRALHSPGCKCSAGHNDGLQPTQPPRHTPQQPMCVTALEPAKSSRKRDGPPLEPASGRTNRERLALVARRRPPETAPGLGDKKYFAVVS